MQWTPSTTTTTSTLYWVLQSPSYMRVFVWHPITFSTCSDISRFNFRGVILEHDPGLLETLISVCRPQLTEAWQVKLGAEKKHRRCRGLRFDSRRMRVRCARSHARVPLCVQEEITSIKPLIKQIGGWLVNERRPSGELLIREAISACQARRMRRRRSLRDYYSAGLPIQRPHHSETQSFSLAESFCTLKQI